MAFYTILDDIVIAIIAVASLVWLYYQWSYQYWDRRNIPTIKPIFPYGNIRSFSNVKEPEYLAIYRCYRELREKGHKHGGIYAMTKPLYIPADAELVKNILITDFHHFYDRAIYSNEKHDPLSANLLALEGQRWRNMRTKLTPSFTSAKMKTMFETMIQSSAQLIDALDEMTLKNQAVDIKDIMTRYTTDVIGSCVFGIDCNSFKYPDPDFRKYGRKSFQVSKLRHFQRFLATSLPGFARFIGIPSIPKEVSRFFIDMIGETVQYRKDNNITRNDVLQLLINRNKELLQNQNPLDANDAAKRPLTMLEIATNSFIFFFGGFETSSTTMTFCFYELSRNQEIQDKLRKEILTVLAKFDGEVTYESLLEMKYLRQVFDETLRKYPVTPVMKRKCTKNYKIPGTDTVIEQGTAVFISAFGLQRDPEYFPDPEKFDPDRFSDESKGNIRAGSYLGFGDGPRICIGKRFALMQMAVGMVMVLQAYKVKLSSRTKMPLEFEPNSFVVMPKDSVWVEFEKI